jgi:hypothetical protein
VSSNVKLLAAGEYAIQSQFLTSSTSAAFFRLVFEQTAEDENYISGGLAQMPHARHI